MSKKSLGIVVLLVLILGGAFFLLFFLKKAPVPVEIPITEIIPWGEVKVIGNSVEGRPIKSYTYGSGARHIVFVGGIHGGYEWNGVLLAYRLMDYLGENRSLIPKNLTVTIIPSANPDGVYKVVGKEGRFSLVDVTSDKKVLAEGRFNANSVDLNRNFECKWKPEGKWQSKIVSAGTTAFSEPEAIAIRDFALKYRPEAMVFYHSQANGVYASECGNGILPETTKIQNIYSEASGYPAIKSFTSYEVTGDATDYLASENIPAITIELKTHESIEWEKNISGIKALFEHYK